MAGTGRLDSWKEIASYLRRGVRTAQRWEREAGLPVRRVAAERGGVYAFRADIDAWWQSRAVMNASSPPGAKGRAADAAPSELHVTETERPLRTTRVGPFLSQDVRVDAESAPGHASLAVYFFTLTVMGLLRPDDGMPAARAAARRALHLDPSNAEARALEAVVVGLYDNDWAGAERAFVLAIGREPVPPTARFHYSSWFLSPLQRHEDSLAQLRCALSANPLYLLGRVQVGMELCGLGRAGEGRATLEEVLKIDPQFGPALGLLGRELALSGHTPEALGLAEQTYASIPHHPNAAGFLAGMLRRGGDDGRSHEVLETLARDSAWSVPRARAESHIVCGELDAALECVAGAIAARDPGIWILFSGTSGVRLRARPRWPSLRAALNLPSPRE
jgi:Tfp pilus assembly protein PilF